VWTKHYRICRVCSPAVLIFQRTAAPPHCSITTPPQQHYSTTPTSSRSLDRYASTQFTAATYLTHSLQHSPHLMPCSHRCSDSPYTSSSSIPTPAYPFAYVSRFPCHHSRSHTPTPAPTTTATTLSHPYPRPHPYPHSHRHPHPYPRPHPHPRPHPRPQLRRRLTCVAPLRHGTYRHTHI
jgi:hypothetical protein